MIRFKNGVNSLPSGRFNYWSVEQTRAQKTGLLGGLVPPAVELDPPVSGRQLRVPEVEEQHYAVGGAVVHDLVLPRVVEDQALALGPLAPLFAHAHPRAARHDDPEVAGEPAVGGAAVRPQVGALARIRVRVPVRVRTQG